MPSSLKKVSVVIPVYNGSNYLAQAIDSVLAQTYTNIEIIVVNDGSTDGGATEKLANTYGKKIRYFHKPNGGVASALNYGILQMTGDYFAWLSHDDVFLPEKLERQMAMFEKVPKLELCFTDYFTIDADGRTLQTIKSPSYPPSEFLRRQLEMNYINGSSVVIDRRKLPIPEVFKVKHRYVQDGELWIRLLRQSVVFGGVARPLLKYRVHPQSDTFTATARHRLDIEAMYEELSHSLTADEVFPSYRGKPITAKEQAMLLRWLGNVVRSNFSFYRLARELYRRSLALDPSVGNSARISLAWAYPAQGISWLKHGPKSYLTQLSRQTTRRT